MECVNMQIMYRLVTTGRILSRGSQIFQKPKLWTEDPQC